MLANLHAIMSSRPPWSSILVWYLRAIAVLLLGGGLIHWARIIGITPWRDVWFWDMPLAWQSATVFFGVLDLVAAIGLWLAVSWGTVMWLFRAGQPDRDAHPVFRYLRPPDPTRSHSIF
ncbi:DUF6163 family protein [uncultured Roseibium sp.]|uniref:DUF6163 family protein n=1 Tax=uncultured Roseibium sp. TaxID=1936171 RepID=UPI003216FD28